jgi:transcription antitermination factor NusG
MTSLSQGPKKWYVIVSKTIHYKKAATKLERLGLSFYLPLQRQLHYWSDRKKWIDVPILSPYIFLLTDDQERKLIFQSSHNLFYFLKSGGRPATVREEEIEKIKLLCHASTNMKMEPPSITRGDLVEITSGPLAGMNGYTLWENGKHRFLIRILSLGQFASVDIDSSCLKVC